MKKMLPFSEKELQELQSLLKQMSVGLVILQYVYKQFMPLLT